MLRVKARTLDLLFEQDWWQEKTVEIDVLEYQPR